MIKSVLVSWLKWMVVVMPVAIPIAIGGPPYLTAIGGIFSGAIFTHWEERRGQR